MNVKSAPAVLIHDALKSRISDSAGLRSLSENAVNLLNLDRNSNFVIGTATFLHAMVITGLDVKSSNGRVNASHWFANWLEKNAQSQLNWLRSEFRGEQKSALARVQRSLEGGRRITISEALYSRLDAAGRIAERTVGRTQPDLRHALAAVLLAGNHGAMPTTVPSPFVEPDLVQRFLPNFFEEIQRHAEKSENLEAWREILFKSTPKPNDVTLSATAVNQGMPQPDLGASATGTAGSVVGTATETADDGTETVDGAGDAATAGSGGGGTFDGAGGTAAGAGPPIPPIPPSSVPRDYVTKVWADTHDPSAADLLNIGHEVTAFARLIAGRNTVPPLSVGIFGEWGSGKSFFMESVLKAVHELSTSKQAAFKDAFHENIVQIRFNAWHYIETDLWASLVEHIFRELDVWLGKKNSETLFEVLTTSKQLRYEAARSLIEQLAAKKAAEKRVADARDAQTQAVQTKAGLSPAFLWGEAVKLFWTELAKDKKQVDQLQRDLGIDKLRENADALATLVQEARNEADRARILRRAIVTRLGRGWFAVVAALALLAAPFLIEAAHGYLFNFLGQPEWMNFRPFVLEAASLLSTLALFGGKLLGYANGTLNALDRLRGKLDEAVANATAAEREKVQEAEKTLEAAARSVKDAENQLAIATVQAVQAEQDFQNDTARGRLNRFIRERVTDGVYAKHLSLIATIRKDFSQLTEIMTPEDNSKDETKELKRIRTLHLRKMRRLLAENRKTLTDVAERRKLRALLISAKEPEADGLRYFNRIVLYIDDLDRCPPERVSEVIQAIHLLLFFRLFVVVVAVDARWMARSLEREFPALLKDISGQARPELAVPVTAQDYIEKIFQIPFWVQRMTEDSSRAFVRGLAETRAEFYIPLPATEIPDADPVLPPPVPPRSGTDQLGQLTPPAPGTVSPPPPPAPPTEKPPEPERPFDTVSFTDMERRILVGFAPLIAPSPRRGKRILNVYQVLKTSLNLAARDGKLAWSEFSCPAVLCMLALLDGERSLEELFFRVLLRPDSKFRSIDELGKHCSGQAELAVKLIEAANDLEELRKERSVELNAARKARDTHKAQIAGVLRYLSAVCKEEKLLDEERLIATMIALAPIVRRYSFDCRL